MTVTSSGNTLIIQMVSDGSVGARGVKILWEAIPKIALTDTDSKLLLLFL